MLFKVLVALLAIGASALPEPIPQAAVTRTVTTTRTILSTRTRTSTSTKTVISTGPPRTTTRTVATCTSLPRTVTTTRTTTTTGPASTVTRPIVTVTNTLTKPAVTVTPPANTVTRPAVTVTNTLTKPVVTVTPPPSTVTRTATFTPAPTVVPPPAYMAVIVHSDPLCGTQPVEENYQNPFDDQIIAPVLASNKNTCRDTSKPIGSFSFALVNAASYPKGCRLAYYRETGCQNTITDISLENDNKCINLPYDKKMRSFRVVC